VYYFPPLRSRKDRNRLSSPYRAPELLFGTRSYDPFAIDLWSVGATFAEFFTPLRLCSDDEDEDDGFGEETDPEEKDKPPPPFIVPSIPPSISSSRWHRDSLFDGTRGELGLAWSIFKIRGTPTADTWPVRVCLSLASSSDHRYLIALTYPGL
jgi:serine/threonine protein kinase